MLEYLLSTDLVDIVLLIMGMSYEEVYLIELGKKIYNFRISSRCSSSDRLVRTENHKLRLRILHHSDIQENEIVGYEFINLGKMMDFIKKGIDANEALEKAKGHYGQWDNAAKYIDPRQE